MKRFLQISAILAVSLAANAATTYGPVENFDVINDTGTTAHGFEIKLHGIHASDVTSMFGDASRWPGMERYGSPSVTETTDVSGQPMTVVTYVGNFNAGDSTWNAGTPSGTLTVSPTDSCWPLGDPNYGPNFPCDHFGVSTAVPATAIEYNWLLENGSPGELASVSSNIPQVTWVPPAAPQPNLPLPQPAPAIKIAPPPKPIVQPVNPQPVYEFGEPKWYKVTATGYGYNVAVEDLVAENAAVKQGQNTQTEWQLLQTDSGNPAAGQVDLTGVAPDPGYASIVYRFEVWEYTGAFDPGTHEALPVNGDTSAPAASDIGKYLGAQHAAVNLDGQVPQPVLPIAPIINNSLPDGTAGVAYDPQVISVTPGNAGDSIGITVTGLPPGLFFDGIDTVSGTPGKIGKYNVTINAYDYTNQLSVSSSVAMNIADVPIVFNLNNADASTGTAFSMPLSATGGDAPFTYAVTSGKLPTGLSVSGSVISGTPAQTGAFPVTITATDSAGGTQTATTTITVVSPIVACSANNIGIKSVSTPYFTDANNIKVNYANATATFAPSLTQGAYAAGQVVTYSGIMDPTNSYCSASTTEVSLPLGLSVTLPSGTAGTAYSGTVKVTGGWSPYSVSVSGLPSGLSYSSGSITGTTALTGTFPLAISVVDSKNNKYNLTTASITINAAGACTVPSGSKSATEVVGKITGLSGSTYPMTVTVGSSSFVVTNCTAITWNGNWSGMTKSIKTGYKADMTKGYTNNGVSYAQSLIIDNGL
ncbi:MAG: putative Ig domain-containing protein [Methylobacter sp.]